MARLKNLDIRGYRSIQDDLSIQFPENVPLVLIGENNAGKSNIVRALDLVLGEWWPGSREPDDHDFWNRNSQGGSIEITARISGITTTDRQRNAIHGFRWKFDPGVSGEKCEFRAIKSNDQTTFASNEMRDECVCIVVDADRRLSYQLSYAHKSTLLSKLMRKFHAHLTQDQQRINRLKIKFDELKVIFNEITEFSAFQAELSRQFGELFAGMSYGLQVDFSAYDPSNFFHSLRVLPTEGTSTRTFDELGTGQAQLLALVFAHAYAKAFHGGIILAIEEPEAHLHPLAQQWLSKRIHEMARDGLQIILTTHNPAFVNLTALEGIVLARKGAEGTRITQLTATDLATYCIQKGADASRTTSAAVLPFYDSHATQEIVSGFFAKKIMLVEGQTEALALPTYLAKSGLDVTKDGIAIIPVMGKGNLAKWWRLFTAYGIPTYVAFDNDASSGDQNGSRRQDVLRAMGATEEGLLTTTDWVIRDLFCVFGQDFEACMRAGFPDYSRLEHEAQGTLGNSKPLVARRVAESIAFDANSSAGLRFVELAGKLRALTRCG